MFWSFVIRISLNVKFQGTEKIEVFSQGTDDFRNLRCETLYIVDYKYVNIFNFAVLDIKLWLEEDDLDTHRSPHVFIQIYSIEGSKLIQILSSVSHNFIFNIANQKIFNMRNQQ